MSQMPRRSYKGFVLTIDHDVAITIPSDLAKWLDLNPWDIVLIEVTGDSSFKAVVQKDAARGNSPINTEDQAA